MPVYRCNQCSFIAEVLTLAAGTRLPCGKCQTSVTLFSTDFYVEKLVERYQSLCRQIETLKQQEDGAPDVQESSIPPESVLLKDQIHSTLHLANETQHQPLTNWFASRQIKTRVNYSNVDTTGFFDEAATIIGTHYSVLSASLDQIRFAYRKDWSWVNIELGNKSQQESSIIRESLRQLYGHTFFSRYSYQKQKNIVGLALQPATPVRKFFEGGWLEWWGFMRLLEFSLDKNVEFSCARGMHIEFQNDELRELDLIFLFNNRNPLIVECKSGEFRGELEKYSNLQKRLGMGKSRFLICNPDLESEQAAGLTAMYGLTFVNLQTLVPYLGTLQDL